METMLHGASDGRGNEMVQMREELGTAHHPDGAQYSWPHEDACGTCSHRWTISGLLRRQRITSSATLFVVQFRAAPVEGHLITSSPVTSASYMPPKVKLSIRRSLRKKLDLPSICQVELASNDSFVEYSTVKDVTFNRWDGTKECREGIVTQDIVAHSCAQIPRERTKVMKVEVKETTRYCREV